MNYRNLVFIGMLLSSSLLWSQVELRTDGIVLPPNKPSSIVGPVDGQLIYVSGYLPALYDGTSWVTLQNQIFAEGSDDIAYKGSKAIGIGVNKPLAHFHISAPDGTDPFRIQDNGNTKFRIFDNGAIVLGTNWQSPIANTLLINTTKTIVRDELALDDNSIVLSEANGFEMFNSAQVNTIHIDSDLNGKGRVTTNELQLTGGSDLSENFDVIDSKSSIVPGLIVSIADDNGNLKISNSKRDKKVAGIISGANGVDAGIIMGQEGSIADGTVPIALSGRAYVYANNENGTISSGDFLTTSSIAGYAMKVRKMKKAQGAIIGKALTPLKDKEGFVLVLINLQ